MNKIKKIIIDNHRKFCFSLLINVFLFIVFNLFFYCRYHTVDDTFMEMFVCGAYGKPDGHAIYINAILGYMLSFFYSIIDTIPWYGIMHILMALFSMSTIMYVFFNRNNKFVMALVLLGIFIFSYEAYTKVQFTKTAAYLATAGYILIAFSFETEKQRKKQAFGILFLVLSYMIRTGMFLGCSAICLGCLVPFIIDSLINIKDLDKRKRFFELVKIGFCSLALIGITFVIDNFSYSSKEWQYYKTFNEYTTQFEDVNFPSFELYGKEYKELGIDYEDYLLYNSTDHNDPELFNIKKMEQVKQLQPYKTVNMDEFVMFALRGYNTLFRQKTLSTITFVTVCALLIFVFGCKFRIINWLSLIYTGCAALFAFAYTYFMHGWFDRTTISIMFSILFTLLYLMEIKRTRLNKILLVICVISTLLISLYAWNSYFRWNMDSWKNDYTENHAVLNEIYSDKEHLYISRTSLPLWKRYYTPYSTIRKGAMSNYSPLGDWIANTPLSIEVLSDYDVVNPYKDMVNNSKVFFIGNKDGLDPVLNYIRRHYYNDAEAVLIKRLGPYEVYSIVSKKSK